MKARFKNQVVRYRKENEQFWICENDVAKIIGQDMKNEVVFKPFAEIEERINTSAFKRRANLVRWMYCEILKDPAANPADIKKNKAAQFAQARLETIALSIDLLHAEEKEWEGAWAEISVPLDSELTHWGKEKIRSDYVTINGKQYNVRDYYNRTRMGF